MKEIKNLSINDKTYKKIEKLAKENDTTTRHIISSILDGVIDNVVINKYPQTKHI